MNATIMNALPDIPRLYTALCEWLACLVYLAVVYRRAKRIWSVAVVTLGLPMMIALQYLGGIMPKKLWTLGMLLAFSGMYLIIILAGKLGKREALYLTARAFVLAELVASLHWQLVTFLNIGWQGEGNRLLSVGMLVVTYAACFSLAWLVERNNFSQSAPTVPSRSTTVGTVGITIVTFAMSNLSFVSTNTPFSGTVGQEVFYIRTLVDFCGFVILFAQQEQSRRLAMNAELASIDAQLQSQHQEYLQSKANLESLGRLAHDLKHQISALRVEVDPSHLAQGFEQLEASVQQYSAQQHSGNPVLDVILTSKTRTCMDRGITLTAVADGKLLGTMSSMDIATLFGNALDNAIEATSKLADPESRLIRLALYSQNRFVVIRVENYFASSLQTDTAGNLRTTKRDKGNHGYGMKSIRHVAQQYGGEISVRTKDHWFILAILLPE
ncbi:ATP-binding protein [Bifidobacterium psychraerophilum]|uniref:Two-component sensor histidine kinase n=1 Tax=Bifidobacterium psychraerophilum TaxID=218140 RepID=A0A087CHY5_9BIFI|nr:ATP-binding protein [Bifidobacterium psychraerophilum]KFI82885.1 two-component sensor histidine kinase [Bifidobacterium psychraerophilum]PKA94633.1 GHKL domain-containing protein [Bifidobacterium psychraerophilum DSM 22366]